MKNILISAVMMLSLACPWVCSAHDSDAAQRQEAKQCHKKQERKKRSKKRKQKKQKTAESVEQHIDHEIELNNR